MTEINDLPDLDNDTPAEAAVYAEPATAEGPPDFNSVGAKSGRGRSPVVPPAHVPDDMSVYEYLRKCTPPLDKKIIDIACSQSQVPGDLKDDAAQEIAMMWSQMKPDTARYKPGQIASYAHQMARHAALRLRRELGSSVRLPGSAFRKRKDGSSYVSPGVLAAALDWSELESWYQTDDAADGPNAMAAGAGLSAVTAMDEDALVFQDATEDLQRSERLATLHARRDELTKRQFEIMTALVEGATYEEVMVEQGVKKGVLMREVAVASTILGVFDA